MKPAVPRLPLHSGRPSPAILFVAVALLALVSGFTVLLWPEWSHNADLSHAFFAPLVFLLLIWESRRQGPLRWLPAGPWPMLAVATLLLAGVTSFALAGIFAASLAWTHALVCVMVAASLVCCLLAGLLILADERVRLVPCNWTSLSAAGLWLLVTPLPDGTYARLTLGLQGWVTGSVLQSLQLLGIPARQHGNIIELATTSVGVEEACSGVRSLISCVFAGFFFAAWLVRRPLGRFVLIAVAPLLALGMNFIRSLTLTLLANNGTDIAGVWHDATGFAILGVTAAALSGLAMLLESNDPAPPTLPAPANSPAPKAALACFWTALVAVLALGSFYIVKGRPSVGTPPPPPDLAALLPEQAGDWRVLTPNDLYRFTDILQTKHLFERTYLRETSPGQVLQFNVYVAYWAPGQAAVSRVASHTPDACWPGSGWAIQPVGQPRESLIAGEVQLAPAEHRQFMNQGFIQNVWFWHLYDGKPINYRDPYSVPALFHLALQYGFRRPGTQFFVRVSSNRPWSEIKDEPLVRQITANLRRIGL